MQKNVIVTDENGRMISCTYLKRAKGLVKNGRAEFVDDNEIRMLDKIGDAASFCISEENYMSEININKEQESSNENVSAEKGNTSMDNRLDFKAREWSFNIECETNTGDRAFITDCEGNLSEAYCLGDRSSKLTEIVTRQLVLKKNTEYVFAFWIKGGESPRYDELCQLQILFNNDSANKRVYKLNRNFIKPVKRYQGWKLFEIPFMTEENEYTQLRFAIQNAMATITPAKDSSCYAGLPDDKPTNDNWQDECGSGGKSSNIFGKTFGKGGAFDEAFGKGFDKSNPFGNISELAKEISDSVKKEINVNGIKEDIVKELKKTFNKKDSN